MWYNVPYNSPHCSRRSPSPPPPPAAPEIIYSTANLQQPSIALYRKPMMDTTDSTFTDIDLNSKHEPSTIPSPPASPEIYRSPEAPTPSLPMNIKEPDLELRGGNAVFECCMAAVGCVSWCILCGWMWDMK